MSAISTAELWFVAPNLLEEAELGLPMSDRLLAAAQRLDTHDPDRRESTSALRPEQQPVFASFQNFLLEFATRPNKPARPPLCRIVLPPRTGKTVVAAHIIERTGLTATFIVPTKTLVRQVAAEFEARLPGIPIGMYYGDVKQIVEHGVNVATYSILQRRRSDTEVPDSLSSAGLVIADEAHHAMTESRMGLLVDSFDPLAVRLALTATPDYSSMRRLCHHFPDLIHEISMYEALQLDLLAPLRLWVAEVNADASRVRMIAGDYDAETLGRLMSTAPFFRATELFRYAKPNNAMPALICCASRQQAYDLTKYLSKHRPIGSPEPGLILGDTPDDERLSILSRFEHGDLDTLVQVGVLIEGWNSPRCKLLVDLAPSRSRVRATQKFFRVMTQCGDREARIYVLIPNGLPEMPILPTDLFGNPFDDYECGALLSSSPSNGALEALDRTRQTPVKGVRVKKRIVASLRLEKPRFARTDIGAARAVVRSCTDFDIERPYGFLRFRTLRFHHRLFDGTGALLLEHLGVSNRIEYDRWLSTAFPETSANLLLRQDGFGDVSWSCDEDVMWLLYKGNGPDAGRVDGWLALGGKLAYSEQSALDLLERQENRELVTRLLQRLKPRARDLVARRFGLDGYQPHTYQRLGREYDICGWRAAQIVALSLRQMRGEWLRVAFAEEVGVP
ncbi:MAG: DEAD/DEAH box helicase family protein [Deltaproteobacteria bacterium]|nr:DEAD/DEAH box helicase family protein [Deltaproteobacteria bacterium]